MTMIRMLDVATSLFVTVSRLGAGLTAKPPARRPARLLALYEFEACPFCRKVRDALTELDLEATIDATAKSLPSSFCLVITPILRLV